MISLVLKPPFPPFSPPEKEEEENLYGSREEERKKRYKELGQGDSSRLEYEMVSKKYVRSPFGWCKVL